MARRNYNDSRKSGSKGGTSTNAHNYLDNLGNFTKIATKINTENPIGMPINVWDGVVAPGAGANQVPYNFFYEYEPGIITSTFLPGIGPSYDASSAANVAGHAEMAVIRSYNSGAINKYDQAALIILHSVVDSAYMWHACLCRLYGTLRKFSAMNRYLPEALITAQGFDYDEVEPKINRLIFLINKLSYRLNTIYIPKMPLFNRHYWLCSKVFREGESEKTQLYLSKPAGLYELDEFNLENPGSAKAKFTFWGKLHDPSGSTTRELLTMDDIERITNRLTNTLIQSASVATISGDVKKAYGTDVMYIPELGEDYNVPIELDASYLHMVHNSTVVPTSLMNPNHASRPLDIIEVYDSSTAAMYVKYAPMAQVNDRLNADNFYTKHLYEGKRIIDFKMDEPDTEMLKMGTAWVVTGDSSNWSFGPEICVNQTIFYYSSAGNDPTRVLVSKNIGYVNLAASGGNVLAGITSRFYMAPIYHVIATTGTGAETVLNNHIVVGNMENYTIIDDTEMYKVHEASILEGWAVPQVKY